MNLLAEQNQSMNKAWGQVPSAQLAVEEHGQHWQGATFKHFPGMSTPKECFTNAYMLHLAHDFDYVEGFVYSPDVPLLIHHAWNLDNGKVLEATLTERDNVEYFGIIIPKVLSLITSHYSVFDASDFIRDLGYPPSRWLFPEEEAYP